MEIVIHIGEPKTASSTLQAHLAAARGELAAAGICYSKAFGTMKARLLTDVLRGRNREQADLARARDMFEAELSGGWRMLILSQEDLFDINEGAMRRLHRFITARGGSPRINAYIRRADEHVVSLHQLRVRGFEAMPLEAFVDRQIAAGHYLHRRRYDRWSKMFGRPAVHVRLFHPQALRGSPAEDFLQWIGLDPAAFPGIGAAAADRRNKSLDPASVEALRLMNAYHASHAAAMSEHFMLDFRDAVQRLDGGERATRSPPGVSRLLAAIRADSEAFAAKYLGARERVLFLAPPAETAPLQADDAAITARVTAALASLGSRWREQAPAQEEPPAGDALVRSRLGSTPGGDATDFAAWLDPAVDECAPTDAASAVPRLIDLARARGYSLAPNAGVHPPKQLRLSALLLDRRRAEAASPAPAAKRPPRLRRGGSGATPPR